jgi:hypothetical protein
MPTDYHKRPAKKEASLDWLSLIGVVSALLILLASSVGYISEKIDAPRKASDKAYLDSGISPPR